MDVKRMPLEYCTALIDADILCYRAAAGSIYKEEAFEKLDSRMNSILEATACGEYQCFLTPRGTGVWRHMLYPAYKSGRGDPPEFLNDCRERMFKEYDATQHPLVEADDLMGMYATATTVSVTIDKDDNTVPGRKYNFVKNEWADVDEYTSIFNFYCQMLIGDSVDSIVGVAGLGKKKAPKQLSGLTPDEMWQKVYDLYGDHKRFVINYNLMRMWRNMFELYTGKKVGHEGAIVQYNNYDDFKAALQELVEELNEEERNDSGEWEEEQAGGTVLGSAG